MIAADRRTYLSFNIDHITNTKPSRYASLNRLRSVAIEIAVYYILNLVWASKPCLQLSRVLKDTAIVVTN